MTEFCLAPPILGRWWSRGFHGDHRLRLLPLPLDAAVDWSYCGALGQPGRARCALKINLVKRQGECVDDGESGYARDDGARWRVEWGQSTLRYWSRLFHLGRRGVVAETEEAVAAVRGEGVERERREEEEGGS